MEQSPSWEANSHSASQEIPHLLRNLVVHYRVQRAHHCPYPEPDESSAHFPTIFLQDPFSYYPFIYA